MCAHKLGQHATEVERDIKVISLLMSRLKRLRRVAR
jgi:hypothetical protein